MRILSVPGHVDGNVLHDFVVVPGVVGADLVGPLRVAGDRIARPDGAGPFVVAGTHVGIPHAGIAGAVEDEVGFGS